MKPRLIARQRECNQLTESLTSDRSEFIIVCGRRRIGKTYLINQFFKGKFDFCFVGMHKAKTVVQLRNFGRMLKQYSGKNIGALTDWYEAFFALREYLELLPKNRKKIIFIDEMPWIDTSRSLFVNALEDFWNSWANLRNDIVLIASGSATSWIVDNLLDNQGGLHNRITRRLLLEPFTLGEVEEYLKYRDIHWVRYDILQCYMMTGGIPFYLSLLNPKLSVAQNIDELCFTKNGALRNEFFELYPALFVHADNYIKIVTLLYQNKNGLTRSEITQRTNLNGTSLTTILKNLEQCDFISKIETFEKETVNVYKLTDFYTIFYFKFIEKNNCCDSQWWIHNLNDTSVRAWQGLCFERICFNHSQQIKKALGILGMGTKISTWKCNADKENNTQGAQIDMLIKRNDKIIHLCEIKFSEKPYNLTTDYETKLRTRMSIFESKTKNKLTLVNTFITTFGLVNKRNHSIVHSEVTIDDIFNTI